MRPMCYTVAHHIHYTGGNRGTTHMQGYTGEFTGAASTQGYTAISQGSTSIQASDITVCGVGWYVWGGYVLMTLHQQKCARLGTNEGVAYMPCYYSCPIHTLHTTT